MEDGTFTNNDHEELYYWILEVEKALNIRFEGNELVHASTFGELCDYVANKVKLKDVNDCTTQQAFYKVRRILASEN